MKPVMQRIVDQGRGDCQSACVASILGLNYEQVPTWVADAHDENKRTDALVNLPDAPRYYRACPHQAMLTWMRGRGFHYLTIPWNSLNDWRGLVGAHCIASMPSQRFEKTMHAVVGTWRVIADNPAGHEFVILHDPSPLNQPYPSKVEPLFISFLVPLVPACPPAP